MDKIENSMSLRGKPLKIYHGYKFRFMNNTSGGTVWRCTQKTCYAIIVIGHDNQIKLRKKSHQHAPNYTDSEKESESISYLQDKPSFDQQSKKIDIIDNNENIDIEIACKNIKEKKALLHLNDSFEHKNIWLNKAKKKFNENSQFNMKEMNDQRDRMNDQYSQFSQGSSSDYANSLKAEKSSENLQCNVNNVEMSGSVNEKSQDSIIDYAISHIDYDCWSDPNVLTNRLRGLIEAGNSLYSGNEEISRILYELRKGKIIH